MILAFLEAGGCALDQRLLSALCAEVPLSLKFQSTSTCRGKARARRIHMYIHMNA